MSTCPHCNISTGQVKAGTHGGSQRYKCNVCSRKYVDVHIARGYSDDVMLRAIEMRRAGIAINKIASNLSVHPRTVSNWIRRAKSEDIDSLPQVASPSDESADTETQSQTLSNPRRTRPTIEHVARLAEVSTSTVSNFINDAGRMSDETRQKIRRAMDELNFTPSGLMRGLRQGRTGIIGVYMYGLTILEVNIGGSVAPALLAGISHAAARNNNNLLLFTGWEAGKATTRWNQFLDGHIDGLLWVDPLPDEPTLARIATAGLPVVGVLTRHVPDGVGYVTADNIGSIETMVKHLYELGHRRIAFAGRLDESDYIDRLTGYRIAIESLGLKRDPQLESTGVEKFYGFEGYLEAVDKWLKLPDPPTALVFPDDRTANRVTEVLNAKGINVPEDISITGFDDVPDAQTKVVGGLTTIRQDFRRIGETSIDLLNRLIAGAPVDECRTLTPTKLVVRNSTGPVRK